MFKKQNKNQLTVLLVSLSLIILVGVSATIAFVFTSTGSVVNVFTPSHVSCAVVNNGTEKVFGELEANEISDVAIKNTGNTPAYIRAAIIVTWKKADGTVYAQKPELGTNYSITRGGNASNWVPASDGYYYCPTVVNFGESTPPLMTSAAQIGAAPEGYTLSIEIVASAIQATPSSVVVQQWSSGVSAVNRQDLVIKDKGGQ